MPGVSTMSHNVITDRVFKCGIKSMNYLMTFNSAINRSQDWMWGLDTIAGLWQSREVSNANWLWDCSTQWCDAKRCLYYAAAALPDSHSIRSTAHVWSRQIVLLCLRVNGWDILGQGQPPDTQLTWEVRKWEAKTKKNVKSLHVSSAF